MGKESGTRQLLCPFVDWSPEPGAPHALEKPQDSGPALHFAVFVAATFCGMETQSYIAGSLVT